MPLFTGVRGKEKFDEVRGSKVPQRSSARTITIVTTLADDRYGPGRIRCEESLLAAATCYGLATSENFSPRRPHEGLRNPGDRRGHYHQDHGGHDRDEEPRERGLIAYPVSRVSMQYRKM
jgi:hypothetical protein